jgi:FkbM family methyltransferase
MEELMKKTMVEYCGEEHIVYTKKSGDSRSNLVASRKGTQEGKVCTWIDMVKKLNAEKVFDIGCNYGEFLVPILNETKSEIYAFEPNTDVYNCVDFMLNNLSFRATYDVEHVNLTNTAISDSNSKTILNIPESSGNASLDINCVTYPKTVRTQSIIQEDIFDYIKDCKNFVMKMDIEGMEHKVLKRIMENDNFDWYCIMFEFSHLGKKQRKIIEEFLNNKKVAGIGHHRIQLKNDNFISYKLEESFNVIKNAHDIIVCKNVSWD